MKKEKNHERRFTSDNLFLISIFVILLSLIFLIIWPPRGFFYDSENDIIRIIIVILGLVIGLVVMIWSYVDRNQDENIQSVFQEFFVVTSSLILFYLVAELFVYLIFFTEFFR